MAETTEKIPITHYLYFWLTRAIARSNVVSLAGNEALRTKENQRVNDKKDTESKKMWKIEGESFEKVKAAREACRASKEEARRIAEEAHKKFWDVVHEAVPEANRESNLQIDSEYETAGLYVLKETDDCCGDILGKLLGAAKGVVKVKID